MFWDLFAGISDGSLGVRMMRETGAGQFANDDADPTLLVDALEDEASKEGRDQASPNPAAFDLREATELIDRLTAVLDEETALVDEGRVAEIEPLQVEKNRLSAAIRQACGSLEPIMDFLYETEDPAIAADRDDMFDAILMLKDASEQNERVIRAALRATSRLVSALVHAARTVSNEDTNAYSATGHVVKNGRTTGSANVLSRSL